MLQDRFQSDEAAIQGGYEKQVGTAKWLDSPMIVSIETFSKCNARCEFCPYPQLDRIGARLPKKRVLALIDEVAGFPVAPARLNLSRVNEPFLDPDLFTYLEHACAVLPRTQLILFTNGQPLTDRVIDRLNATPTFNSLSVSFNEHDPETYYRVMGLRQDITRKRLKNLHRRAESGSLNFAVSISRVGLSSQEDIDFLDHCATEFPNFLAGSSARFDWVGTNTGIDVQIVPDSGCLQWFSLHILADGKPAFCCIDGVGDLKGSTIDTMALLDIYNIPAKRALRAALTSRRDVEMCRTCIHGMSSRAYMDHR